MLHSLVECIQAEASSSALNAWYLDDGILIGPSTDLATAFNITECDGPPQGLYLNRSKLLLYMYIPSGCQCTNSPLLCDIPIMWEGFRLLGCPVDPPSYCEGELQARVGQINERLTVLHDLNDSHMETTLLRFCHGFAEILVHAPHLPSQSHPSSCSRLQ